MSGITIQSPFSYARFSAKCTVSRGAKGRVRERSLIQIWSRRPYQFPQRLLLQRQVSLEQLLCSSRCPQQSLLDQSQIMLQFPTGTRRNRQATVYLYIVSFSIALKNYILFLSNVYVPRRWIISLLTNFRHATQ